MGEVGPGQGLNGPGHHELWHQCHQKFVLGSKWLKKIFTKHQANEDVSESRHPADSKNIIFNFSNY